MPFSSEDGKAEIKAALLGIKHDRMLDIGCGSGTYAKLFPEAEWDGVEVWLPYLEKYNLKELYKNLYVEDARTWEPTATYDVAIAGDVLEHMTATKKRSTPEEPSLKRVSSGLPLYASIGIIPW